MRHDYNLDDTIAYYKMFNLFFNQDDVGGDMGEKEELR